ncbi:MAG: tetratricopeptide repeat protein [Rhizonema sp. PD38]|nr:tetratricopeptide repeat protein [Rhizonema sp. PD38]
MSGGLPRELNNRCRQVLLQCDEFNDYENLIAVFVTDELLAFKFEIRNANSRKQLVNYCLEDLLQKRTKSGEPVLPIFLANLKDRYERGNALHDELADLYNHVYLALKKVETLAREIQFSYQSFSNALNFESSTEELFVGRKQLIQELLSPSDKTRIIAILGIPGVGKTSLIKQIASRLELSEVFWYEFHWGLLSFNNVMISLAQFIDKQTDTDKNLTITIQTPELSDEQRISIIIEHLNKNRYYLFFESIHIIEENSKIDSLFSICKQKLKQSIIFITSRSKPCFCKPIDEAKKIVKIVQLDGLRDFEEVQDFFTQRGIQISPELIEKIDKRFGGLPLALELIATLFQEDFTEEDLLALAEDQAIEQLFDEIYERLNPCERKFLTIASLFTLPFSENNVVSAYRAIFSQYEGKIHFTKLKRQLLIHTSVSNYYTVHEAIRTLTFRYTDEPSKYQIQLADFLVAQMQEQYWVLLEAILLYCHAKSFNHASTTAVDAIDVGLIPYHSDLAEIILNKFEENMVSPEKWMWLLGSKGMLANFWRRYNEAENFYQRMLHLAGELQDKVAAAIAFQRLGVVYTQKDDEIAQRSYLNSLALKKELNDIKGQAEIYNNLGEIYTRQQRAPEAESVLKKGLNLLESINAPDWQKISIYANIAHLYAAHDNWQEAARFTQNARQIAEEMRMTYDVAMLTYDLGVHEFKQGNYEAAGKYYSEALEITKISKLWQLEELVQVGLVKLHHQLGNYNEAITHFQRVAEIEEEVDDKSKLATTYFDIGSFYSEMNDYQSAFSYYEKGIDLFEHLVDDKQIRVFLDNIYVFANKSGTPQSILRSLKLLKKRLLVNSPSYALAKVYGTLGEIYLKLLNCNRVAIVCMHQEINLLLQINRTREQVEALINLAVTYEYMERYVDTLDISTEAIRLAEIYNFEAQAALACYNRGNCFTLLEIWQEAENDYQRALVLAENVGDTKLQESVSHNFGEMYRRSERPEEAVRLLKLCLELVRQRNDIDSEITGLNNLGLAYGALSQTQAALECFNNALNLSRQHYRKRDESRIFISLGNLYLLNDQPEQAKSYYENALIAAREIEDTDWEEGSILSLASAHKELGTFDNIADDFKTVAEQACNLAHHESCIKFLTFGGQINLAENEPESAADMFDKALSIALMRTYKRFSQCGKRVDYSFLAQELREVIDGIGDSIKESVENGTVEYAVAMYQSLLDKLHSQDHWKKSNSWIFDCLKPMVDWLNDIKLRFKDK